MGEQTKGNGMKKGKVAYQYDNLQGRALFLLIHFDEVRARSFLEELRARLGVGFGGECVSSSTNVLTSSWSRACWCQQTEPSPLSL